MDKDTDIILHWIYLVAYVENPSLIKEDIGKCYNMKFNLHGLGSWKYIKLILEDLYNQGYIDDYQAFDEPEGFNHSLTLKGYRYICSVSNNLKDLNLEFAKYRPDDKRLKWW